MKQEALTLITQFENLKKLESFSNIFMTLANQRKGGNNVLLTASDAVSLHTLMMDLFVGHNEMIRQFVVPPEIRKQMQPPA